MGWLRSAAALDPDAPARTRLVVPQMPPMAGNACCWGCKPEAVEAECLIHAPLSSKSNRTVYRKEHA